MGQTGLEDDRLSPHQLILHSELWNWRQAGSCGLFEPAEPSFEFELFDPSFEVGDELQQKGDCLRGWHGGPEGSDNRTSFR